jgi:hypothetical protein
MPRHIPKNANNKNGGSVSDHHATQTSPVPTYPQTSTISTNTSPIPPSYSSLSQLASSQTQKPVPVHPMSPPNNNANTLPVNKQNAKQLLTRVIGQAISATETPTTNTPTPASSTSPTNNAGTNSHSTSSHSHSQGSSSFYQRKYQSAKATPNNYSQASQKSSPGGSVNSQATNHPLSLSSQNINVIGGSKRISQDLPNKLHHSTSYVDNSSTKEHHHSNNNFFNSNIHQQSTPALNHNFSKQEDFRNYNQQPAVFSNDYGSQYYSPTSQNSSKNIIGGSFYPENSAQTSSSSSTTRRVSNTSNYNSQLSTNQQQQQQQQQKSASPNLHTTSHTNIVPNTGQYQHPQQQQQQQHQHQVNNASSVRR